MSESGTKFAQKIGCAGKICSCLSGTVSRQLHLQDPSQKRLFVALAFGIDDFLLQLKHSGSSGLLIGVGLG